MTKQTEFLQQVALERKRQIEKYGDNTKSLSFADLSLVLNCEVGEANQDLAYLQFAKDYPAQYEGKGSKENLRKELVQIAAVCMKIYDKL